MKIKTIVHENPGKFDDQVNEMLARGYMLGLRTTITVANELAHYAQLVELNPTPGLTDPMETVRAIREVCLATSLEDCLGGKCPLEEWCSQLAKGNDPTDWVLPGEEAAP